MREGVLSGQECIGGKHETGRLGERNSRLLASLWTRHSCPILGILFESICVPLPTFDTALLTTAMASVSVPLAYKETANTTAEPRRLGARHLRRRLRTLLRGRWSVLPLSLLLSTDSSPDIPQHRSRPLPAPVEEDAFGSSGESSDGYQQEPKKQKRVPKSRDTQRPAQKKRKRKQLTEEDLQDLPPEKGRRDALDSVRFTETFYSKQTAP